MAAVLVAVGGVLVTAGAAWASRPVGHYPTIRFWGAPYDVVTMEIPGNFYCPKLQGPHCEWELYVNEPDIPSQTVVGTAKAYAGTATNVQVPYPPDFCGVIQADALVGPVQWFMSTGKKMTIDTCGDSTTTPTTSSPTTSPPTTSPPTTSPPTTKPPHSPTTTAPPHTAATSVLPFTGATSTEPPSDDSSAVDATTATTAPATLPFTGADLDPLVVIGSVLILAGLSILTSLEQRRRALQRLGAAVSSGAQYSSRASHWFLGD
jgi:hypothetical protein